MFTPDAPLRTGLGPASAHLSFAPQPEAVRLTASEARRSGKTTRMIQSLPKDGAVVVVHSHAAVGIMRDLILHLRGPEIAGNVRVVSAPSEADEQAMLRGVRRPVFRDHFVEEQRGHRRALEYVGRL